MAKRDIYVDFKVGIHSRPAALIVKKVREYPDHTVVFHNDGKHARGDSLVGLLSLGIKEGSVITLEVDGPFSDEILLAIADFIENAAVEES